MNSATAPTSLAPLFRLALGTFVAGTESFMIAGLFGRHGGRPAYQHCRSTGQLVMVFALVYAINSPVLTALTGAFDDFRSRRGTGFRFWWRAGEGQVGVVLGSIGGGRTAGAVLSCC